MLQHIYIYTIYTLIIRIIQLSFGLSDVDVTLKLGQVHQN